MGENMLDFQVALEFQAEGMSLEYKGCVEKRDYLVLCTEDRSRAGLR